MSIGRGTRKGDIPPADSLQQAEDTEGPQRNKKLRIHAVFSRLHMVI